MQLQDLNKSQLITLINNYDQHVESNDIREWYSIQKFLTHDAFEQQEQPYLSNFKDFRESELAKEKDIPRYIITDAILDIADDIYGIKLSEDKLEQFNDRVDNVIKNYESSINNTTISKIEDYTKQFYNNFKGVKNAG